MFSKNKRGMKVSTQDVTQRQGHKRQEGHHCPSGEHPVPALLPEILFFSHDPNSHLSHGLNFVSFCYFPLQPQWLWSFSHIRFSVYFRFFSRTWGSSSAGRYLMSSLCSASNYIHNSLLQPFPVLFLTSVRIMLMAACTLLHDATKI